MSIGNVKQWAIEKRSDWFVWQEMRKITRSKVSSHFFTSNLRSEIKAKERWGTRILPLAAKTPQPKHSNDLQCPHQTIIDSCFCDQRKDGCDSDDFFEGQKNTCKKTVLHKINKGGKNMPSRIAAPWTLGSWLHSLVAVTLSLDSLDWIIFYYYHNMYCFSMYFSHFVIYLTHDLCIFYVTIHYYTIFIQYSAIKLNSICIIVY